MSKGRKLLDDLKGKKPRRASWLDRLDDEARKEALVVIDAFLKDEISISARQLNEEMHAAGVIDEMPFGTFYSVVQARKRELDNAKEAQQREGAGKKPRSRQAGSG